MIRALLDGHIGVVFADEDPIQTTKTIFKFKSENEEVLEIIGGRFEGKLYSAKDVEAISKLPGKARNASTVPRPLRSCTISDCLQSSMHC